MTTTTIPLPDFWDSFSTILSESSPSFAPRAPQAAAARLIRAALGRTHAAVDAPTGVGKAYAVLAAAHDRPGRTVISTATRALQAQLADRDIPALQAAGAIHRSVAVLEGRSHFRCSNRARAALRHCQPAAREHIEAILAQSADRRDRMDIAVPDWAWAMVCSDSDACRALNCHRVGGCAYTDLRDLARRADIVVVNHHVLLADAALKSAADWRGGPDAKPGVLGPYSALVIDEAHALESAVTSFASVRVSLRGVQSLATRARRLRLTRSADLLLDAHVDLARTLAKLPAGALLHTSKPQFAAAIGLVDAAATAAVGAGGLDAVLDIDLLRASIHRLSYRLTDLDAALVDGADRMGPRAPSTDGRAIVSDLVDVSGWLRRRLFDHVPTVVTSATLAVPGNRDWVCSRIGLDARVHVLPGVFDLASQRLVYVTPRAEQSAAPARATAADVAELRALLAASRGRALVLFPAMADLRFVHDELAGTIDHPLLAQGVTVDPASPAAEPVLASSAWLAEQFAVDTHSVLLATRTFFEGMDFPGEACSLVVVVRFPNLRPDDPLVAARRDHVEAAGGNAWRDYQEPSMQLLCRQAAGRAIRRIDDYGVVAVLDPRCGTKAYAKATLRALRPSVFTMDVSDVSAFLNRQRAD